MNCSNATLNQSVSFHVSQSWIVGLTCLDVTCLLFYIFILSIMLRDKTNFSSAYYRIVIGIGFSDITVLISVLVFNITYDGFVTNNHQIVFYVRIFSDRIGDGIGYFPNLILNVLIALNRFVAIILFQRYKTIFSKYRTRLYILASFITGCLISGLFYFLFTDIYQTLDGILTFCSIGVSFTAYGIALIHSYIRIKSTDAAGKNKLYREIKMTCQALVFGSMLLIMEVTYLETSTDLDYNPIFSMVYILYAGLNPVINLCFDKWLRIGVKNTLKNVGKCLNPKNQVNATPIVHLNHRPT